MISFVIIKCVSRAGTSNEFVHRSATSDDRDDVPWLRREKLGKILDAGRDCDKADRRL